MIMLIGIIITLIAFILKKIKGASKGKEIALLIGNLLIAIGIFTFFGVGI